MEPSLEMDYRYRLYRQCQGNASHCEICNYSFTPVGSIQGYSPQSAYEAAKELSSALDYIALGGMLPQLDILQHLIYLNP